MQKDINSIAQHLFHKNTLDDVSEDDLNYFISKYPYTGSVRFMLAKKKFVPSLVGEEVVTGGLYFNNALWYNNQLNSKYEEPEVIAVTEEQEPNVAPPPPPPPANVQSDKTSDEPAIEFQSYHTIDYFASQGIRLQQADFTKDKLGQQLKSFTEWLKSMKKLPTAENAVVTPEDTVRQQGVIQDAASSIEEKEVYTEAMAEVWAKQGNGVKAIEIYEKLSLLNPSKSAYFAAKIDQLK